MENETELARVDFVLKEAVSISGWVFDGYSTLPLSGVRVFADGIFASDPSAKVALTDQSGHFELKGGSSKGPIMVRCSRKGYYATAIEVRSADVRGVEIPMERMGGVEGAVIDALSEEPITRFEIRYGVARNGGIVGFGRRRQVQNVDGRFHIEELVEGTYLIEARAPGYGVASSRPISLRRGQVLDNIRIRMGKGGAIRGRIRGKDGYPVRGGRAVARRGDERFFFMPIRANPFVTFESSRTDATGVFEIQGLPGGEYRVQVFHDDWAPAVVGNVEVSYGEVTELGNIDLSKGGRIEGTVLGSNGLAVQNRRLVLRGPGYCRRATSDLGGSFSFENVPCGKYTIAVESLQVRLPANSIFPLTSVSVAEDETIWVVLNTNTLPVSRPQGPPASGPFDEAE